MKTFPFNLGAIVAAIIVFAAVVLFYTQAHAFSPAGATFGNQKLAFIVWTPSTDSATSTSILNTDDNDRIITSADYWCANLTTVNGAPRTSWAFTAATTSISSMSLQGNTNFVLNTNVATTTSELYVSSTTPGLLATADYRRWATGSYMTFNANASSTATCVIGVKYLAT